MNAWSTSLCARRASSRALLGVLLPPMFLGSVAPAAEPSAEQLFREGRALLVAGRFAEACAQLEQSQRLEPRLGTQLNIAFCQERLGKLASAWLGFRAAASTAQAERDVQRERFARERAAALEPRVPRLGVRVPTGTASAELRVLLDGSALAPGEQELPLDPGEHTASARHHDHEYWRTTVTLRESERVTLVVPAPLLGSAARPEAAGMPDAAGTSRFVYEVGAFVAFLYAATEESEPNDGPSSIRAELLEDGSTQRLTCATATCRYLPFDSAGFVAGVSGFVGYALLPQTDVGVRFWLGARAGGGGLLALGPSASFLLAERFRVGPSVLFGTASHNNEGLISVQGPTGQELNGEGQLSANLGLALGLGVELGVELFRGSTSSLAVQATPLFLYGGNGSALSLPVAAAYRWR